MLLPLAFCLSCVTIQQGIGDMSTGEIGLAVKTFPNGDYIVFKDPEYSGRGYPNLVNGKVLFERLTVAYGADQKMNNSGVCTLYWLDESMVFVKTVPPLVHFDAASGSVSSKSHPIGPYSVFNMRDRVLMGSATNALDYAKTKYMVPSGFGFIGRSDDLVFCVKENYDGYLYYKTTHSSDWLKFKMPKHIEGVDGVFRLDAKRLGVSAFGKNPKPIHLHPGWSGVVEVDKADLAK